MISSAPFTQQSEPSRQRRSGNFAEGSIAGHLFRLARPLIFAQIISCLYNIVDRMFIGHLPAVGGLALTGLGVVFPLISLLTAFANWFGQGGAVAFAIARGRGHESEARKIQAHVYFLLLVSGLLLSLVTELAMQPLLELFGAEPSSLPFALPYARIYVLGTLFAFISLGLNPLINAQGDARTGMLTVLLGACCNLVLDPLFIFVFGWGVAGAAWASVLSQGLSALWVLRYLRRPETEVTLSLRPVLPDWTTLRDILRLGLANFVFMFTNSATQTVCNQVLLHYGGPLQIGVMTVIASLRQVLLLISNGLTAAARPIMSYNFGARKPERVCQTVRCQLWTSLMINILSTLFIFIFPEFFFRLFSPDASLSLAGTVPLRLYFSCFVFMSLQTTGQATFTALGYARAAVFFSLLRKLILLIPLTLALPSLWGLGALGVYLAEALSQVLGGSICFCCMYFYVYRRLRQGLVTA